MLSPNLIIPFDGNHADIPSGFERDTRFDGKFVKGASTNLANTGGSDTHSHTFNHSHAIASHRHDVTVSAPIDGSGEDAGMSGSGSETGHTHFNHGYTGYSNGELCADTNATLNSTSSLPPYYEVIFIKATAWSLIPLNGLIFRLTDRTGMTYHTASENRFLRGAATGQDAGDTGGNSNHTHSQTHTHTAQNHSHATGYTDAELGWGEDGASSAAISRGGHTHSFTVQNNIQNMNSDSTASDSQNLEPLHRTLKVYKATQKSVVKVGDIVLTDSETNPVGWIDCDGNNGTPDMDGYYVKNTQSPDDTDGANTHSHTITHGHTGNGTHTHTVNNPTGYSGATGGHNGSGRRVITTHRHNINSVTAATANYDSTAATSTTENNEPAYIKMRFIQFAFGFGAAILHQA